MADHPERAGQRVDPPHARGDSGKSDGRVWADAGRVRNAERLHERRESVHGGSREAGSESGTDATGFARRVLENTNALDSISTVGLTRAGATFSSMPFFKK